MILIFGGAYQGKLEYALERFCCEQKDVYRCSDEVFDMPGGAKIIYELDKWILALIKAEQDTDAALERFISNSGDVVVICNDISCGIVPTDPMFRKWREAVGRALADISRVSAETVRLFCGIPSKIKSK